MTDFDIENVEWPADVPTGPTRTSVQWVHGEPGDKGRGATSIGGLEVVPADAYRKAVEEIARLESECREWKEQCEKGDAKLVRECEEWREQCAKLEKEGYEAGQTYMRSLENCQIEIARLSPIEKAADELAEAVENFGGADSLEEATDAYDLRVMPALSNYLKVKESHERG